MSIVLYPDAIQLDIFSVLSEPEAKPAPVPTAPQTETRGCGKCGGTGRFKTKTPFYDATVLNICDACNGSKVLTAAKPDCPPDARTHGMDPAAILSMVAFTRAMVDAGYSAKVTVGGDVNAKKAKQCCNALIHNVASDRPQPTITTWELAIEKLATLSDWERKCLGFIEDDPDPGACARRVAAVEAKRGKA